MGNAKPLFALEYKNPELNKVERLCLTSIEVFQGSIDYKIMGDGRTKSPTTL
jgi:hypothetical protein